MSIVLRALLKERCAALEALKAKQIIFLSGQLQKATDNVEKLCQMSSDAHRLYQEHIYLLEQHYIEMLNPSFSASKREGVEGRLEIAHLWLQLAKEQERQLNAVLCVACVEVEILEETTNAVKVEGDELYAKGDEVKESCLKSIQDLKNLMLDV